MRLQPRIANRLTAISIRPAQVAMTTLLLGIAAPALASAGGNSPESAHFNLEFTGESYANLAGGIRHGSVGNEVLDATFALSNGNLGWHNDGHWFLDLKHIRGADPSETLSGDVQVASNIAAPAANRVYEFWYQQNLFSSRAFLRAGIVDLNKMFGVVPGSGELNNSSFGIQPTLSLNVPSSIFPKPGWALAGGSRLSPNWKLQIGWFQGHPAERSTPFAEGHMLIGELRHRPADTNSLLIAGIWRYTQPHGSGFGNPDSDWGTYLAWSAPLAHSAKRVFMQAGISPAQASFSPCYLEAGYSGPAPLRNRPNDRLNLGVARAWVRTPDGLQAETALEANYDYAVTHRLRLAPDLQYILRPAKSAAKSAANAWVFMLRLYFSLH